MVGNGFMVKKQIISTRRSATDVVIIFILDMTFNSSFCRTGLAKLHVLGKTCWIVNFSSIKGHIFNYVALKSLNNIAISFSFISGLGRYLMLGTSGIDLTSFVKRLYYSSISILEGLFC